MNKKLIIQKKNILNLTCVLIILIFLFTGCKNNSGNDNKNNDSETQINRTSLDIEIPNNLSTPVETELSTFSTPIKSDSPARSTNLQITCSKINNQIIEKNSEFSFEKIVGKSTPEQGYQKAEVFVNKEIVYAYGGGNCQVSSTLYNAVLAIPQLTVTERHPHGRKVTYVPEGKDAAVSYGSLDFKFINNTGFKIKIYANTDGSNLTIKIVKIE